MSRRGTLFWRLLFETGDKRRIAKQRQDLGDLEIQKDIPYIDDGEQGHLMDIYATKENNHECPVIVNIHGGGLFASYKEVNANFNYEWARLGYKVISISYRRIPEVTLKAQIDDVMQAMHYISKHEKELEINLDNCYLSGDSAGALLALYVLSINGSERLQDVFGINGLSFQFKGAGFISIMLDTQRNDLMRAISDMVLGEDEQTQDYASYILNPLSMLIHAKYPPIFMVTGAQDLIREDTLKLRDTLENIGHKHLLLDCPKGKERKLDHVFAVKFPMWPESKDVFQKMKSYLEMD